MKKLFNYMLVIGLTFMASIGLAKAADYDLSFKFYELTGSAVDFVDEVYNVGNAIEIDPLKLKAGQEFVSAVYSKSNTGLAEGFNIDVIWDDSVLEPWTVNIDGENYTYASVDFENGIYPTYTRLNKLNPYWNMSVGGPDFYNVDYYVTENNIQFPLVAAGFSTSQGVDGRLTQDGALFFLYFKVKDNASVGTEFDFTIGSKSKFVSDGGETTLKFSVEYANCLVNNSTEDLIVKGDINNNGRVDIGDSMLATAYVLKKKTPNERQFTAADVNNDGKINVTDSMRINLYVIGAIAEL